MSVGEIFETQAMRLLEAWLRSWSRNGKRVALVYGPTGSGKTTTIVYVAGMLGYTLVTVEDKSRALRLARASPSHRLLIHLDRPYEQGWRGRDLSRLARATLNPVVVEDLPDRRRFYQHLLPAEIRVEPPRALVLRALKRSGRAAFRPGARLSSDLRQIVLMADGAGTYEERGWYSALERWARTGDASGLDQSHLPAVLDTVVEQCYGWECVDLMALLVAADLSGRPGLVLDGVRLAARSVRPSLYFYERRRMLED